MERPPVRHMRVARIHIGRIVKGVATIVRTREAWNIGIVGRGSPDGIGRIDLIRNRQSRVDPPKRATSATVPGRIRDRESNIGGGR
jgi:hypothetical protein